MLEMMSKLPDMMKQAELAQKAANDRHVVMMRELEMHTKLMTDISVSLETLNKRLGHIQAATHG